MNSNITFSPPPSKAGSGVTTSASVARESEWTQHAVQQQRDQIGKVGLNAHMESMAGVTFVAFVLLDMLSDALEFGNKRKELMDTFRTMFGLKGAREAAIAREKQMPSTQPSLG